MVKAPRPRPGRLLLAAIMLAGLAANACLFSGLGPAGPVTATITPSSLPASATAPGRTAVLSDLVGDVLSGPAGSGKDTPASDGQTLAEGTELHTGKDGKAKVSFSDGTILRLRPDTLVTLSQFLTDPNNPFTRLLLGLGKVFVILKGGQLEIQSPAGVAVVTGSFMSVEYQADANAVVVTCLEGSCTLRNDQGGTALTTGQAASLAGGASGPVLRWMSPAEIQSWLDDNPEAQSVAPLALTALPAPSSTVTLTPTASATASAAASPTPTGTATSTPTATASRTRTPRPRPTSTSTSTPTFPPPSPSNTPVPPTRPKPSATPVPSSSNPPPLFLYTFISSCAAGDPQGPGTFHVSITGPKQAAFDVMPQQKVGGELPPGKYSISWVPDQGPSGGTSWSSDQGAFSWTFCKP